MAKKHKTKKNIRQEGEEEMVDYAAGVDVFAGNQDDSYDDDNEEEGEQQDTSSEDDEHVKNSEESSSDDDGSEDESLENQNETDNDEEEEDEEEESDEEQEEPHEFEQPKSANGEPCTFDLRNLMAMNAHQINTKTLYSTNKKGCTELVTIPAMQVLASITVDEEALMEKAADGCTQLIAALWQLPKERSSAGPMVLLPSSDESRLPRALPPPEPKAETKWEKFARERGIPLNKEKRSQKVWDEATGTWMFRHGYQKANDESKEWPIMEVKDGDDPFANPWEKQRESKRARVEKNVEQRMRNQERAGKLEKGTTTRALKSRDKSRKLGKLGGNADRDSVPVGVPVDIKNTRSGDPNQMPKRGKVSTLAALAATQRSTASLGKYDKMREGEPERKKVNDRAKKRKYDTATDRKVLSGETERSLKVLKSVVEGGGAAKERDIRKGKFAKGETAYDYEFDDGLGPSSYKKKKGRAGVGKQKKMTKKRMK